MCHINIRYILKNFGYLEDYLCNLNHSFTCITLSETWLIYFDKEVCILKEHNAVAACHQNERCGGVAQYIPELLSHIVRGYLNIFNDNI